MTVEFLIHAPDTTYRTNTLLDTAYTTRSLLVNPITARHSGCIVDGCAIAPRRPPPPHVEQDLQLGRFATRATGGNYYDL